jgi:hypothetical protein
MPKLITKDGKISFVYDNTNEDEKNKKDVKDKINTIKSKNKDKGFKSLSNDEKDTLLEQLLKMHNLI